MEYSGYTQEQLRAYRRMQATEDLGHLALSVVTLDIASPGHISLEAERWIEEERQPEEAWYRNGVMGGVAVKQMFNSFEAVPVSPEQYATGYANQRDYTLAA